MENAEQFQLAGVAQATKGSHLEDFLSGRMGMHFKEKVQKEEWRAGGC